MRLLCALATVSKRLSFAIKPIPCQKYVVVFVHKTVYAKVLVL